MNNLVKLFSDWNGNAHILDTQTNRQRNRNMHALVNTRYLCYLWLRLILKMVFNTERTRINIRPSPAPAGIEFGVRVRKVKTHTPHRTYVVHRACYSHRYNHGAGLNGRFSAQKNTPNLYKICISEACGMRLAFLRHVSGDVRRTSACASLLRVGRMADSKLT